MAGAVPESILKTIRKMIGPAEDYTYFRHSISDRAVSCLEKLFDTSASDYEKQELKKYISMIRAAGMND